MQDRLGELLSENDVLYGLTCRDATVTDIELMAQVGYHIVWIDLEHGPQSAAEAIALGRTAAHLGMVPLVRILELSRTPRAAPPRRRHPGTQPARRLRR